MAYLRGRDGAGVAVHPQIAMREANWPARTQQVAYCFSNQFELPVLFYVLTILEIITRHADLVVVLAWVFRVDPVMHGPSIPPATGCTRGALYGFGAVGAVDSMWVIFMVRILLGLP